MQSKVATVAEYLAEMPEDRRAAISAVRKVILVNLDKDCEQCMVYGMIGYAVPHRVYPAGYHCDPSKPLMFAALASQKQYMSLYLMSVYGSPTEKEWLAKAWAKSGKKLDIGKSCIRFKTLDEVPLDVIGEAIGRVPAKTYVRNVEAVLAKSKQRKANGTARKPKAGAKKAPAKKKAAARARR